MQRRDALRVMAGLPVAAIATGWPSPAAAQAMRGFDQRVFSIATGEEIQRQPDLWVFELQFKTMRMAWVDVTDPKSGQTSRDQIWYLAYRTVNRALTARQDTSNTAAVNTLDPLPGPPQFIPEFTLTTYDERESEIPEAVALDEVVPEAVRVINRIERRRQSEPLFKDSVDVVQPLPQPVPDDTANPEWIYGVATWRSIDPETDFFSVVMRGFSNGYELRAGPDGQPIVWRKSILQKFTRRGDRFDPNQLEFELDGLPKWIYLPDPAASSAPSATATS